MKKIVAITIILILALGILPTTAKAENKIIMNVEVNFFNELYWQSWNRVEVQIDNPTNEDFKGTIEVSLGGTFIQDIEVKKGERAEFEFYLTPIGFEMINNANVRLRGMNNRIITTQPIDIRTQFNHRDNLVGIGGANNSFQRITNLQRYLILVDLKADHFNNLFYLKNLNLIIIEEGFTLNNQQKNNALKWVELGGTLVIEKNNSIFKSIFKEQSTDMSGEDTDNSQLIQKNYGSGNILISTISFKDESLKDIVFLEEYLNQIIMSTRRLPREDVIRFEEVRRFLALLGSRLSALRFLSPGVLFMGLFIYIALIGPINFIVLKKLKKWDYGWITIPSLALLFTISLFIIGSAGRSDVLTNNQINFIEHYQKGAQILSFNSIFIPKSNVREIQLAEGQITPLTSGVRVYNNQILDLSTARVWSMERMVVLKEKDIAMPQISLKLHQENMEISLSNFSHDLFDSYLFAGNQWFRIGEIRAGESKNITLTNPALYIDYEEIFKRYEIPWSHSQIIETIALDNNYIFIGIDDSQDILTLDGVTRDKVLNFTILRENVMDITIADPTAVIGIGGDIRNISFDDYHNNHKFYYFRGLGTLEIHFNLPNLDFLGYTAVIDFANIYTSERIEAEAFNVKTNTWQRIELDKFITLPNLENYSLGGKVRIRLLTTNENNHLELSVDQIRLYVKGGAVND